ncbi:hypothetical protein N7528_003879 [Penicillium herquei]|nr:hypothetical protein N7528_003879 [Penicillium herquei]
MSSHHEIFPREGIYIDPIAHAIKKTFLHPIVTISVFAYTELYHYHRSLLVSPFFYAAIISLALWINEFLSHKSANNWTTDPTYDWRKEIVVVTGGSSGIGASIVKRLLGDGVRVVVLDIVPTRSDMRECTGYLFKKNRRNDSDLRQNTESKYLKYYHCDLSEKSQIQGICNRIRKEVGHPTVLEYLTIVTVNNAGLTRGRAIAEATYNDILITLQTNLIAPFLLTNEFLPDMIKHNHGHIISIASMSAYLPPAGLADYSASKSGLIAFHDALRLELKHRYQVPRVRSSLAVLSFTETPLFKGKTHQSSFLFPLMHMDTIGDAVVDTLYSGSSRTMYFPGIFRFFAGIRGAPEWWQNIIREQSKSLKVDFRGRQNIDPKTGKLSSHN